MAVEINAFLKIAAIVGISQPFFTELVKEQLIALAQTLIFFSGLAMLGELILFEALYKFEDLCCVGKAAIQICLVFLK